MKDNGLGKSLTSKEDRDDIVSEESDIEELKEKKLLSPKQIITSGSLVTKPPFKTIGGIRG